MMIRIVAPHFVAGAELTINGRYIDKSKKIAPIIYYMRNWNIEVIKDYCIRKGWKLEFI